MPMKRILLILFLFAASASVASAQKHGIHRYRNGDEPAVYVISVKETDTIYSVGEGNPLSERHEAASAAAVNDHKAATRKGFQQVGMPSVVFANGRNTFSFAIGGYVNLRTSYGFNSNFLTGFRISQAKHTSDTVLIAESATDLDTTPGGYYFCYSWAMDVSPWPYHGMQCNIAWLDGHASSVTSPTGVPGTKSASRGLYQENVLGNKFTVRNKWDPLR